MFLQRLYSFWVSFFSAKFSATTAYKTISNFQNQPQTVVLTAKGNQIKDKIKDIYRVYSRTCRHVMITTFVEQNKNSKPTLAYGQKFCFANNCNSILRHLYNKKPSTPIFYSSQILSNEMRIKFALIQHWNQSFYFANSAPVIHCRGNFAFTLTK